MKNIRLLILSLLCIAGVSACMPEEYELGAVDVAAEDLVPGIAYSITQDSNDPNTIYLKNLMTGYTPLWEHPQGRSQDDEITLKIAFKGQYTFKFGVLTRGGYVYGEPYVLDLTTDNLSYVDDPLWNMLTGGKGQSKTWKLDIDADGTYKYFPGPLYFYGTDDWYGNVTGGQEATDYNGDGTVDSWNWCADWAGNGSWMFSSTGAMDYGTMTFDLIDGAHVVVDNLASGVKQTGTFLLDAENYTLTMSDAGILHDPGRDAIVTKWGSARVIQLTEDFLQLGVIRDNDPNEGPCLLVYNYVSQNYWDNPPVQEEPEKPSDPVLPEGWQDIVGTISQTAIEWKLSDQNPLDWCNLDGSRMNGWLTPDEYADWLGTPDPSTYEGFSLTMDSADNSYKVVIPDGTEVSGTYTLDEKGVYTFDNGIPSFTLVGWASFATTAENQLRIMEIITKNGIISEMWVGAKDPAKDEYMGYHLVANVGAGGPSVPSEPVGTVLEFDSSKLVFGDLEGNGNLRIEFYNEYGSTAADPGFDKSLLTFSERMSIALTVSGTEFLEGAVGSYEAFFSFADADWGPQYWGENGADFTFTGDGTYIIDYYPGALAEGVMVWVVDIKGNAGKEIDLSKLSVRVDQIVLDGGQAQAGEGSDEGSEGTPSYKGAPAYIGINSADWSVQNFPTDPMTTSGLTDVTGFGTYTTTFDVPSTVNGLITLVVDVYGYATVFGEDVLAATSVTVDKIAVDGVDVEFNAANIVYGDLEGKGNLRIELYNEWGPTKTNQVIDPATFVAESSISVTYTLSSM